METGSKAMVIGYSEEHEIAIRTWDRDRFGKRWPGRSQWNPSSWSNTETNASVAIAAQALGIPMIEGPERYAIARALLRETANDRRVQAAMLVLAVDKSETKVDVTQDWDTAAHRERARKYMQRKRAREAANR